MPFTLRRTRRAEFAPSRSLVDVFKSKIHLNEKQGYGTCEYHSQVTQPYLTSTSDRSVSRRTSRNVAYRNAGYHYYQNAHQITHLPVELLAYIFVLGSEDDVRFPVVVSHVCRMWRAISLHTPALWRHITLDARRLMWMERIRRAKACTLDVEIRPQMLVGRRTLRRSYLDARAVELYMHTVSPLIYRWRSLRVEFQHYAPYLWSAALGSCCGVGGSVQAPNLEHLELVHPLNDDAKEYLLFNGHAPRLRSATLEGVRLTWLPSLFANLISLDYTHHGYTRGQDAFLELYCMLQVCPQLEELRLAFPPRMHRATSSDYPALGTNARLHLMHLRTLTLEVSSEDIPTALIHLMSRLRLRGLRSLALLSPAPAPATPSRYHRDRDTASIPPPPPFFRLHPFLTALHRMADLADLRITHSWCDVSFLGALLKFHVPQLKHLALASPRVDDGFLWRLGEELRGRHYYVGHLDMDEYVPGVWHNGSVTLSTLGVLEIADARVSREGLLAVVRRMLGGGVLWVKEVWVTDCKGVDSSVVERAARFGVNVRIWANEVEVTDAKEKDARSNTRPSMWRRIYR